MVLRGRVTTHLFYLIAATASTSSVALASRSPSPSSSSTSSSNSNSGGVLVSTGLQNLGNTCYLNSQLQCAYHIPRIRQLIASPPPPQSCEEATTSDEDQCSVSVGLQAFQQVFQQMEQASSPDQLFTAPPVAPHILCRSLGISVYEQQDSQEFWKLLLPELKLPSLMDLYQGAFEDYIAAVDGSGREKRREEPFLDLSLDVTSPSTLESLQNMFGTPELLSEEEGNGWRPEKGADKVDALKGSLLRVQGLPSILQLHLKRFQYDWQTDMMSKINDRFTFRKVLNMSKVLCNDAAATAENVNHTRTKEEESMAAMYDLQSIVIHAGEYGSGHYYAYVRPDILSNSWYRCNDSEVRKVSFREVTNDAFGGRYSTAKKERQPLLKRLFGISSGGGSFGWGGRTSSAYMLQYVRRQDIPKLYCHEGQSV